MEIWDGNKHDTTNYKTNKYLEINSCGFQNVPSGWTVVRQRGRYDYHILFVCGGKLEAGIGDKRHILKKGNFVIYKPNEEQYYKSITDTSSLWLHFGGTAAEEILKSFGISGGVYETDYSRGVFEIYSTLIRQFNQPNLKKLANGTLLTMLARISDAVNNIRIDESTEAISEILTYINMNYNKDLTIDEMAKRVGYSKSRFSHLFKEQMRITPIAYRNKIRLANACELLSSSGHSIGEIANSCGFDDQLYFCRIFKKKYGMSPSEWRRGKRNKNSAYLRP